MPRVKRGVTARAKHKKVFEYTKGHRGIFQMLKFYLLENFLIIDTNNNP